MEVSFREIIVAFIFSHSVGWAGVALGWGSCFLTLLLVAIGHPHFTGGRRRAWAESLQQLQVCGCLCAFWIPGVRLTPCSCWSVPYLVPL